MQLTPGGAAVRARLAAATGALLAAVAPVVAKADSADPKWQFDASGLIYGEASRATIVEPIAKITRLFAGGQALSASLALDAMTGASPTGELPPGRVQTTTSASGTTSTTNGTEVPTQPFHDLRGAADLGWVRPIGSLVTFNSASHYSREKDYQSTGVDGSVAVDLFHRMYTLTFGGGINRDEVFPVGGRRVPFTDGTVFETNRSNDKRVNTATVGLSRVMTRRWLLGVTGSRTNESGYLTDPYKVVSLVEAGTGYTNGFLTENRPGTRLRTSVLASSVYQLANDVLYASYRYYWDDWGIRSHTVDLRYRHDFDESTFLQPHVRVYSQGAADFYRLGIADGAPLPEFASSDSRLGHLNGVTLGATYGFRIPDQPGQFTIRGEYLVQWGRGDPANEIGVQRTINPVPAESIGSVLVGWSVPF